MTILIFSPFSKGNTPSVDSEKLSELTEEEIKQDVNYIINLEKEVNEKIRLFNRAYARHGIGISISLRYGQYDENEKSHLLTINSMILDKEANLFAKHYQAFLQ